MPRRYIPVSPRMQRKFEAHGCRFENDAQMHPVYAPDGSYIGDAGVSGNRFRLLARLGIFEPESPDGKTSCLGKAADGKWYGWSHRAMYGFEIGSSVKKGDCAFVPSNEREAILDAIRFWSEPYHENVRPGDIGVDEEGQKWIEVHWTYSQDVPNESLRGKPSSVRSYAFPDEWGRGEWTAKTEAEAKQMAIDFASSVS